MTNSNRRIFGTEQEYGSIGYSGIMSQLLSNGGMIYDDGGKLEYASPESTNALDAIIYNRAGDLVAKSFAQRLFRNNVDRYGHTYGSHESYSLSKSLNVHHLAPFLITRQIFAGSGNLNTDGTFHISQRSRHINNLHSNSNREYRPIVAIRNENISAKFAPSNFGRLHLVLGDANMCEVAEFLKIGTTGLVLDMLEENVVPKIFFDDQYAIYDIRSISTQTSKWGMNNGSDALTIQRAYLQKAKETYSGRDSMTDKILSLWSDVLTKLETNTSELFGVVDWVTKKMLIEQYAAKFHINNGTDNNIQNMNLQYHDTNRESGLFFALQKKGLTDRLLTDKSIEEAAINPPSDTRAYFRGMAQKMCSENNISYIFYANKNKFWNRLDISNVGSYSLSDPFDNYSELLAALTHSLDRRGLIKKRNIEQKVTSNFTTNRDLDDW